MIRYDLVCRNGHEFDSWFRNSKNFDQQAAAGLVSCPLCGTSDVAKQLMAPRIGVKSNRKAAAAGEVMVGGLLDAKSRMLMSMIRELRAEIDKNTENVGEQFAAEARRIHYGEAERRGIRGLATREEAVSLEDEGIEIFPVPRLPEESN
jgi:hypothetical protein